MSFGCERSCSNPRRVIKVQKQRTSGGGGGGGIYPHIKFERDLSNIVWGLRAGADEAAMLKT